jgi:hypothetical protein
MAVCQGSVGTNLGWYLGMRKNLGGLCHVPCMNIMMSPVNDVSIATSGSSRALSFIADCFLLISIKVLSPLRQDGQR